MKIKKIKIIIFVLGLIPVVSQSYIRTDEAVYPELVVSSRAQAMGNAFICKVDDSDAAFYNPAGLGTVRKSHVHFNVHAETNKGLSNNAAGGSLTDSASNASKGFSFEGHRKLLLDNKGEIFHSRFQTRPNILFRYFTAGFFISQSMKSTIGETTGAQFEYYERMDYGPYAALNLSLFGGIWKFGVTGVLLNRHEAYGEAPQDQTFTLEDDDYYKGFTEYIVAGSRLTLPIAWLPTFAAVLHNAGDHGFKGRAAGAPSKIRQQLDVGFSLTPQIGKTMRLHLEANYKDIALAYSTSTVSLNRRIVFGAEFDILRRFFLRFGYSDAFGSAGVGIRTKALEVDISTYSVEATADDFMEKEDRRYVFSLSTGF